MSDIELIIKIPEETYHDIKVGNTRLCSTRNVALYAVANGTPLPKGHGRLIDADVFISNHFGNVARLVDEASTIIEADEEVEE